MKSVDHISKKSVTEILQQVPVCLLFIDEIPSCAVDGDEQSTKRCHHSTDSTNYVPHQVVCCK